MDDSDRNNEPTTSQNTLQPAWSSQPNMDDREEGLREVFEEPQIQNPFRNHDDPPPEQIVEGFDMLLDELRALQERIGKTQKAQLERALENKRKTSTNAVIEPESADTGKLPLEVELCGYR
jgi:hypothetical protein